MTGGRLLEASISEKNDKKITNFQAQIGRWAFNRAQAFIRIFMVICRVHTLLVPAYMDPDSLKDPSLFNL